MFKPKPVNPNIWKRESFSERVKKTKKIIAPMPPAQKISYIWTYFHGQIIAALIGLLVLIGIIATFSRINTKAIYVVFCDTHCNNEVVAASIINQDFTNYMGSEADKKPMVKVDTSLSFREDQGAYQTKLMEQKFSGEMQAHAINLLIGRKNTIVSFGEIGMMCDLQETLDADTFRKLKDKDLLFTCTVPASEEDGTPELTYYCGIYLNTLDPNYIRDAGFTVDENTCIAIPYGARRQARALQFLDMLLSGL